MQDENPYTQWKSLVPILYDWLANHNLVWPSLSCRWGPQIEHGTYKTRQRIYVSEQTDGTSPNTLVVLNCDVVKPRVAAAEHISKFNEEAKSPFIKKHKTIIHPGEVNRIRELPQNSKILATHTDSPEVYIWNLDSQPNRASNSGPTFSRPDLILNGHTANAEYALALSPTSPLVLSGGQDAKVVIWGIEDHVTNAANSSFSRRGPPVGGRQSSNSGRPGSNYAALSATTVNPRGIFEGHTATVEDVQFRPSRCISEIFYLGKYSSISDNTKLQRSGRGLTVSGGPYLSSSIGSVGETGYLTFPCQENSSQEFCSVGDDSSLILWDARTGTTPAIKVERAHDADLHCVDWNSHNENHILTGSADASVRLFDHRKLSTSGHGIPLETFRGHTAAVLCAQWCPDRASVFGSSGEDGFLNIWDFEKVGKQDEMKDVHPPSGLFFRHAGHRDKIVDFHWNVCDPWTIVSVSDDCDTTHGGGTLQMWRMSDLIHRPADEVLAELSKYRADIVNVSASPLA